MNSLVKEALKSGPPRRRRRGESKAYLALALAYARGEVSTKGVMAALGKDAPKQTATHQWAAYTILKAVQAGLVVEADRRSP